jgi:hypothetical protein
LWSALAFATTARGQDPFADGVELVRLAPNGGFGSELLPDIVLGPPRGSGLIAGSTDVLALGDGGEIVLRFDTPFICDGPGVDFTIFENAFHNGSLDGPIFDELAFVAVSQDGEAFFEFPFDRVSLTGLAGQTPVESHPDNGISPLDPAVSGGDSFDLADVGLAWARFVRITDVDGEIPDVGDHPIFLPPPNGGFDLDAVAAVNPCPDETPAMPTVTPAPPTTTPTAATTPSNRPAATATPTFTAIPPSATPATPLIGDVDGDGDVTAADAVLLIRELFDGDGSALDDAGSGDVASDARADASPDFLVTVADLLAVTARRSE